MKYLTRTLLIVSALLLLIAMVVNSCKDDDNEPVRNIVYIDNLIFNPSVVIVPPGGTVIWENDDTTAHTVTSNDGLFDSGNIPIDGHTYEHTFADTGTYNYHCAYHSAMIGTVLVKEVQ